MKIIAVSDADPPASLLAALEERGEVERVSVDPGPGSELMQAAAAISELEPLLAELKPAAVLVLGDGTHALAAALVAVKLDMPLVRIGAGVRSGDSKDPEEVNRAVTDRVCDLLLCADPAQLETLRSEGLAEHTRVVGDAAADPGAATEAIARWMETYTSPA